MKIIIWILAAVFLFTGCTSQTPAAAYKQISQEEAASIMASTRNYILLDVRTPQEYAQGHIPGAVNIPNEVIGDDVIPDLPAKDQIILIYCRTGRRSKEAAQKLAGQGYTNILEFGGIETWAGPVTTD